MGIGIALGNTVDSVGPALQRGEFVGVSIPIGMSYSSYHHPHLIPDRALCIQLPRHCKNDSQTLTYYH